MAAIPVTTKPIETKAANFVNNQVITTAQGETLVVLVADLEEDRGAVGLVGRSDHELAELDLAARVDATLEVRRVLVEPARTVGVAVAVGDLGGIEASRAPVRIGRGRVARGEAFAATDADVGVHGAGDEDECGVDASRCGPQKPVGHACVKT